MHWFCIGVLFKRNLLILGLIRPHKVREELNQNFEKLLSDLLLIFSLSAANPQSLYRNVTEFYMGGKEYVDPEDPRTIEGLTDVSKNYNITIYHPSSIDVMGKC